MTARAQRQNIFGFGKKQEPEAPRRGSALTLARATKLAKEAGYQGSQNFGDWLEAKHLDSRSEEVIRRLGQAYRDGIDDRERADSIKEKVRDAKRLQKEQREEKKEEGLPVGRMKTDAELKAAFSRGLTLYEALRENPSDKPVYVAPSTRFKGRWTVGVPGYPIETRKSKRGAIAWAERIVKAGNAKEVIIQDNPAAFDRCVKAVQKHGGAANAYAVCTAQGKRNPGHRYTVKVTVRSPRGHTASIFRDGVWVEDVGPVIGDYFKYDKKAYDSAALSAARDRVFDYKVLDRARKNPADASAKVFKEFHGYEPSEVISVKKKVHHHEWLAVAGEFAGIQVNPKIGGDSRRIGIGGEAYLSFNEDKNQLFLTGGDQFLSTAELKKFVGADYDHELLTLGKLTKVGYATNKTHLHPDDGGEAVYSHIFRTTNKAGRHVTVKIAHFPDLIYRVRDQQFEISGGSYKIKAEGIDQ